MFLLCYTPVQAACILLALAGRDICGSAMTGSGNHDYLLTSTDRFALCDAVMQAACIPLALAGRDICGSAMTGSGKTAAFALPILERLLYRRRQVAATYVLILAPTRELAAQVISIAVSVVGGCTACVYKQPTLLYCTGYLLGERKRTRLAFRAVQHHGCREAD
jgi:superfamily II DNA/RNA helicase